MSITYFEEIKRPFNSSGTQSLGFMREREMGDDKRQRFTTLLPDHSYSNILKLFKICIWQKLSWFEEKSYWEDLNNSFPLSADKHFCDKLFPEQLDPKTVLIYCPHRLGFCPKKIHLNLRYCTTVKSNQMVEGCCLQVTYNQKDKASVGLLHCFDWKGVPLRMFIHTAKCKYCTIPNYDY